MAYSIASSMPVKLRPARLASIARRSERVLIPAGALVVGLVVFSLFLLLQGKSPAEFWSLVYKAGFGSSFSWGNTLSRAAPLLFAALCVALPARLGLIVIGGEGAVVLGGLAAGAVGAWMIGLPAPPTMVLMAVSSFALGALWIGTVGWLRHWRGVNETIASLLMAYIAIALLNHFVEGPLRDPQSLNKPSTASIDEAAKVGVMPWLDVHWGLLVGVIACVLCWILIDFTRYGFAARVAGANLRAAQVQGLPTGWLMIGFCALGGGLAGLAGYFEVSAVHGSANGSLIAGYGYSGILIAFIAQHHPLTIIPATILLAGFEASSGLVQRRMELPDATVLVMQGCLFISILVSETLYGRIRLFVPEKWQRT